MLIEPCCVHKQLPPHLQKHLNTLCTFTTNGDVTIEKFLHAVLYLAGPHTRLLLVQPHTDVYTLRQLQHCLDREWVSHVTIATQQDQTPLCNAHLRAYGKVDVRHHPMLSEPCLLLRGERTSLLIQGTMTMQITPAHTFYTALLIDESDTEATALLQDILAPLMPKIRKHQKTLSPTLPRDGEGVNTSSAAKTPAGSNHS